MHIEIVDNVVRSTASALIPAIEAARDVRVAVAYITSDGLAHIASALDRATGAGAAVEFLVGMDPQATDPAALRTLNTMVHTAPRCALLCIAPRDPAAIYHPKMYLARDDQMATAIIGSSNLTRRGLTSNIEANVVISDDVRAEIISEIYSTYNRLKYHPDRFIPDEEVLDLFGDLCRREKSRARRAARDPTLRELRDGLARKVDTLPRPRPARADLLGWLELVYDALPDGLFTNQDIYRREAEFREHYPQNQNIRAKIRQQLQILHALGFIEHPSRGVWRKLD